MTKKFLLFIPILIGWSQGYGQLSVAISGGVASSANPRGNYEYNDKWPTSTNTGGSNINFLNGGSGGSLRINAMWDVSKIVSLGLLYQNLNMSTSLTQRSASSSNFALICKLNMIRNTRSVVPFVQVGYYFLNQSSVTLGNFTSPSYSNQQQPGFSASAPATHFGYLIDLGAEVKLSSTISLIATGGIHGLQLIDDELFFSKLNFGTGVQAPQGVGDLRLRQFSGGLKYYFGKQKKKRDF